MQADILRVRVISEHPIVVDGVIAQLAPYHHAVLVVQALEKPVDVVIYDVFGLHEGDGTDLEKLVKKHPGRVLAMSRALQPGLTARAMALGAIASVSIADSGEELLAGVLAAASGELQDGSAADVTNQRERARQLGRDVRLSPREQEVLSRIVAGASNREIVEDLYLSINTVKSIIRSAYTKIGAQSRAQAVAWGVEHGFPSHRDPDRAESHARR